ncbi:MAG: helix-turn-helix transcriptional regulator [Lentisphaeria bacterium]|nr:helix-turn-helix transcriptional regulator [Lentisphaeria bacterium]
MGVSSFRKHFRDITGSTFADYELACRFRQAASELMEGTMVIKELAEKYGFYDVSHFIRLFKKKYGVAPLRFVHNSKKINNTEEGNDDGYNDHS